MKIHLSENIRKFRKNSHITQEQLAEALGVTVAAVSKWEVGTSTPDILLIMEMADFFEISVDVLLGYELHKQNVAQTVTQIRTLRRQKDFDEALTVAEKALQKYPNSFDIVYQSALLYYVILNEEAEYRAIALFRKALTLLDQNTDDTISEISIQNRIAECHLYLGKYDEAIELLKKINFDGLNNGIIGNILASNCHKADEALPYLSEALNDCCMALFRICIGYANAYLNKKEYHKASEIMLWFLSTNEGLTVPETITYFDKVRVIILLICAEIAILQEQREQARSYLKQARDAALRFDAAPEYGFQNFKYYHGSSNGRAFDDFGETAMQGINKFLHQDKDSMLLQSIWEELCYEE